MYEILNPVPNADSFFSLSIWSLHGLSQSKNYVGATELGG